MPTKRKRATALREEALDEVGCEDQSFAKIGERSNAKMQRKRDQNRLSQQCAREKKLAQSRSMSTFMDLLKQTKGNTHNVDSELIKAYMDLMVENQRLSDALLRMRKKLLSISNSAATAADDVIFQSLLRKTTTATYDTPRGPDHAQTSPEPPHLQPVSSIDASQDDEGTFGEVTPERTAACLSDPRFATPVCHGDNQISNTDGWDLTAFIPEDGDFESDEFQRVIDMPPVDLDTMFVDLNTFADVQPLGRADNHIPGPKRYPTLTLNQQFDALYDIRGRLSPTQLCNSLETACVLCICRSLNIPTQSIQLASPASLKQLKSQYMARLDHDLLNQLATTALDLKLSWAGLRDYIAGIGGLDMMRKVLCWRLCPTKANARALPDPWQPTQLQWEMTHSLAIDTINWPELRDRLIVMSKHNEHATIDELIRSLVLNTVFEIPQLQLSLNTFDVYHNAISRRTGTPALSHTELQQKLECGGKFAPHLGKNLTRQFWEAISRQMATAVTKNNPTAIQASQTQRPPILSTLLGADKVPAWRLNSTWPALRSLLQGTLEASGFPTVPATSLQANEEDGYLDSAMFLDPSMDSH